MLCHEEPLCPNSPLFKYSKHQHRPCRFLIQEDFFPSFLPGQVDADEGLPFDLSSSL
jgi:hypothetical protein